MVDRIYVHAPALPENSRKQSNRFSSSTHHQLLLLSLAVIIASAFAYITSAHLLLYYSVVFFLAVGLFLALKHLIGFLQTRNQFEKAVIEITSFGVQLVSIYGGPGSSHNETRHSTTSSVIMLNDQTNNVSVTHNNVDNGNHLVHKRLPHKTISKRHVRSFIPRERIIDVIVMEIVWPHCVWSQVAFRVDKGSGSSKSCNAHNGVEQCSRRRRRQELVLDKNDVHDDDNVQSNVEKYTDTDDQCTTTTSLNIQDLMKLNRVAIVPAFPEECRGLLSYKECLRLQEEIERLLGQSETR